MAGGVRAARRRSAATSLSFRPSLTALSLISCTRSFGRSSVVFIPPFCRLPSRPSTATRMPALIASGDQEYTGVGPDVVTWGPRFRCALPHVARSLRDRLPRLGKRPAKVASAAKQRRKTMIETLRSRTCCLDVFSLVAVFIMAAAGRSEDPSGSPGAQQSATEVLPSSAIDVGPPLRALIEADCSNARRARGRA